MNNTTSETYIGKMMDRFYNLSPRAKYFSSFYTYRDERESIPEPEYFKHDIVDYPYISDPSNGFLNRSSLNQSQRQNPLNITNSSCDFKELEPLNPELGGISNPNSSVNFDVPSYMQNNQYPIYDNPIGRDEFGLSNNNIIKPYRYEESQNPLLNPSNSIDFGVTKSSVQPPPDYNPINEEYKHKLLAELDDSINEISNPNPIQNNGNNNNTLSQSSLLPPPLPSNNIYPPEGLPVTMTPPQFQYEYNNNIQESKYNDNNNKNDMKTTSSQIIEGLDMVMLPFKKKMIKQEMILPLQSDIQQTNIISTTTIDEPPTLHQLESSINNELPLLSQPLLIDPTAITPPDSMTAMRKSIESNIPIVQTSMNNNINPPIIQQSISLPNNNNNSYLSPPNIDPPLLSSYDDGNVKEIDKLIQQLKEENDKIKTEKSPQEIINEINVERELSDSDDETKPSKPIKPITPISYSSPPLNLLNHNKSLLYNQQQLQQQQFLQQQPPLSSSLPPLSTYPNLQPQPQLLQQPQQIQYNPNILPPPTQLLPSVLPVYGESKVINNSTNSYSNNTTNNPIGTLGNQPIYQAGTTNPSVILATSIRSQPLVINGIPLPDSTPYINPITAHTISTNISPPLSNIRPNEQLQYQQTSQPQPPPQSQQQEQKQEQKQEEKKQDPPADKQQQQQQQPQQSQITSTPVTSLPPIIISGIPVSSPRIFDAQPIITNRNNNNTSLYSLQQNYPLQQPIQPLQPLSQQQQQYQQLNQIQQLQQNQNYIPCYQKPQIHSITPVTNMNIQSLYPLSQPLSSSLIPTISPPLPPIVPTSTNNDLRTIPVHPNQFQYVINTIGPNGMIQSTPYTITDALVAANVLPPQPSQQQQGPPISQPLYSTRSNTSSQTRENSINVNNQTNVNHDVTEKLKSVLDKSAQQRRKFQTQLS